MITKEQIDKQREFYSKPILIGNSVAVKVLTARNKHFGILDNCNIEGRTMLSIDPGYVFGDGTHATTAMCIEAIEKHIQPNAKVLDIGCGTGIQSIVALLLGADSAEAVDIDLAAVKVAEHNSDLNAVSKWFSASVGNLTEGLTGTYDLIIANILADPAIKLLSNLDTFTDENSVVIISGVSEDRDIDVTKAIQKAFTITDKTIIDGWVCYVLTPGASETDEISDSEALEIILGGGV